MRRSWGMVGAVSAFAAWAAFAGGVLDVLEGDFEVVAAARNDRGTMFVEVDREPGNVTEALRAGVRDEPGGAFAIITPDGTVHYAYLVQGRVYAYATPLTRFVNLNHPAFTLHDLTFEGHGRLLSPQALADARRGVLAVDAVADAAPLPPEVTAGDVDEGGVLDRLGGVSVVAWAENDAGTVFVELDRSVEGLERALRHGLLEEAFLRMAVVTPDGVVTFAERYSNRVVVHNRPWVDLVKYPVPFFRLGELAVREGSAGRFVSVEGVEAARASSYSRPAYSPPRPSGAVARAGTSTSFGVSRCESTVTGTRSSMTCRDGWRTTHRSTCRVNPVTFGVTCTSTWY